MKSITLPAAALVLAALTASPVGPPAPRAAGAAEPAPAPRAEAPTIEQKAHALHERWKDRFAAERFNAVVAPPFVIAGDADPARLARYRDGTILAAAAALRAQFFKTEPSEPVLILLFETAGPYKRLAKKWFGDADVPHYGFYRHRDRTMLMNVGTGTGTLVHELAHALIAPDFPDAPDWFNEGLASLYEQCSLGRDPAGTPTITGHENWRLPGLQKAVRDGTLRPLEAMIKDDDFRHDDRVGVNYAQARYLMLYLQHKGLLRRYYAAFRDNHQADPTGLETLKKLVEPPSLEQFEKDWRAWVMTLRFGNG